MLIAFSCLWRARGKGGPVQQLTLLPIGIELTSDRRQ